MEEIIVSIIVPVYKPEEWFKDCIISLANQTYCKNQYEVILILNGDLTYSDYVHELIKEYLKDANVIFIQSNIANVSNARNIGINSAKGEYIVFVDSDDVVSNYFLEGLVNVSSKNIIGVSHSIMFESCIENTYTTDFIITKENNINKYNSHFMNRKCFSGPVGFCINNSIIGKNRFNTKFQLGEDNLFWLSISHKINSFSLAHINSMYYIRERNGSLSRSKYSLFFMLHLIFFRNIEIISIFFKHPIKNDLLLFLSKLLTSTKNGIFNYFKFKKSN